jgi:hypothetical protein
MRIANDLAVDAGSMTGTATINSDPIWLGFAAGVAIQAVWTGTPNGSFKLQCSIDSQEPTPGNSTPTITNWEDVADSSTTVTGAAGSYTWNVSDAYFRWIRVVYTNTSSTGTLTVRFNTKGG